MSAEVVPKLDLAPLEGRWAVVALLSTGLAIDMLARLALYSVFPLLRQELIESDLMLGLLASAFPWTYGALSPAAGFVGDRFRRRNVLIGAVCAWSIASMLCGLASAAWQLIAMRVVLAAAQVCYMPTAQAMVADFHGVRTRARASGFYQAGSYVGILLAGLPAAFVAARVGWRAMLILCGALGLLLAAVMWRKLPAGAAHFDECNRPSLREAVSLVRKPSLMAMMGAFSLTAMSFWVLFTYLPLFIYEQYRLSLESAAFQATFYMQVAAMLLMPLFGAASDRWTAHGDRNRFLACALVSLLGVPALLAVGGGGTTVVLAGGLILFGLVMAGTDASWLPMLCHFATPRQRATAYGLLNMSGTLAGGFAAMATALLMKSVGLGALIAALGGLYVLLSVLTLLTAYKLLPRDRVSGLGSVQ